MLAKSSLAPEKPSSHIWEGPVTPPVAAARQ